MTKKNDNLLQEITDYLKKYVILPNDDEYKVLATYAIHTWALPAAHVTPYLYVHSPEPGSGKTTLLEVLGSICNSPEMTGNITPPALANLIDSQECTLLFDEIDQIFTSKSAANKMLQGVLNMGYKEGGKTYRVQGEGVRKINVFAPKVLAGIANDALPLTLIDRAVPIQLRRKRHDQKVTPFYSTKVSSETDPILDAIENWINQHMDMLERYEAPDLDWNPRQVEIATPLLAIAEEFGCADEIAESINRMVCEYKNDLSSRDASIGLIRKIAELFFLNGTTKIFSEDLMAWLDLPQTTAGGRKLADMLSVYDVETSNVRIGNQRRKGFTLADFATHMEVAGLLTDEGTIKEDALV